MSVLATAIYFLTSHISEVQYNNWGTGVWNSLLEISGTVDCNDNNSSGTQGDEYHKACIKKDIETYYDLSNFWNSDYWKTWYEGKLKTSTSKGESEDIGSAFLKLGSWQKFREVCTKGFDELMKKGEWNKLSGGVGAVSSIPIGEINSEECLKAKVVQKKK